MRIMMSGLLNWVNRSVSVSDLFLGTRRLEPYFVSLFSASSPVKPFGVVCSCWRTSEVGILQNDWLSWVSWLFREVAWYLPVLLKWLIKSGSINRFVEGSALPSVHLWWLILYYVYCASQSSEWRIQRKKKSFIIIRNRYRSRTELS